ncbi:MAG: hybrid sensor histidine kinase/response regulator [Calditrichaeota bacterium]|nr:MAG: hybrid sensor histidine kinase/response regulator [Calditrichota bacterium]
MKDALSTNYKILLVDDDPVNISILEEVLEENYTLKSVATGEQALAVLPAFSPDLILLDIMMPGLNGYEVCQKIRANPLHRHVKIILVSGRGSIEDRLDGYNVGADDYITKPFVEEELDAKVKVFLRLKYTEKIEMVSQRLLNQFSNGSSTPLARILSANDMLQSWAPLTADQMECVRIINNEGEHLLQVVEESRRYCELKRGIKLEKCSEPLKLNLGSLHTIFEKLLNQKSIELDIDVSEEIEVIGDWRLLPTAFQNLVETAIRLTENNAKVCIEADANESVCSITFQAAGNLLGNDDLLQLTNFISAPESHINNALKLANAQSIFELHGSSLIARNVENRGVAFSLSLPVAKSEKEIKVV